MFQQLLHKTNYADLIESRDACAQHMDPEDINYLKRLDDEQQYPCIIMYGRTSSQCVESMNVANRAMRDRTSVCVTNAVMLLMNLESKRYNEIRDTVWKHAEGGAVLTPRGRELADDAAKEVPRPCNYIISMEEKQNHHVLKVRGNHATSKMQMARIKSEPRLGQYAYHCNCRVTQVKGVPCRHVVAIAKLTKIEDLNMVTVMPFWWTTAHWKLQFPKDTLIGCSIDIEYLIEKYDPDNSIHYCPDFAAVRKKGQPTKEELHAKSPLELAMEKSKGVKKKRKYVATEVDLTGKLKDGAEGCV
jgi:hypothetical protein